MSVAAGQPRGALSFLPQIPLSTLVFLVAALGFGAGIVHPALVRFVILLALMPAVFALAVRAPSLLLYCLAVWLAALGLTRRLVDATEPTSFGGFGDPLLLVEPAVIVVLTAVAQKRGAFQHRSRLANGVLVLSVLCVLEVVNPLQGSPLVGAAGLLFLLVPMLSFFVGRALVDDRTLRSLLIVLGILSIPAVLYGLFQQFRGFPSWDQAWIHANGYTALNVGQLIRPFGTFSSAVEYDTFIAIGIVVFAAGLVKIGMAPVSVFAIGLLSFGVFFESARGVTILTVFALAIMFAARRRLRGRTAFLVGIVGLVLLVLVAHGAGAGSGSALSTHELKGLGNPLNSQDSDLSIHLSAILRGLKETIAAPFGHGPGAVSRASAVFGGTAAGSDLGVTTFGVALGIPGLIAYVVVAVTGLSWSYRLAVRHRSWWPVAVLGILVLTALGWGNGGEYSVAWLPWLVLGWVDRTTAEDRAKVEDESKVSVLIPVPAPAARRAPVR